MPGALSRRSGAFRPARSRSKFSGYLDVRSAGQYRLHVFAAGAVRLELNGNVLLDATSRQARLARCRADRTAIWELPLEVRYRRSDEPARLALFWEGPQFELEPITARWLLHDAKQTPDDALRARRAIGAGAPLRGVPRNAGRTTGDCRARAQLPGRQHIATLARRLAGWRNARTSQAITTQRRMPHFAFTRDESEAIADFLLTASEKTERRNSGRGTGASRAAGEEEKEGRARDCTDPSPAPRSAARCFAASAVWPAIASASWAATACSAAEICRRSPHKRPADFFARWLADPAAINRQSSHADLRARSARDRKPFAVLAIAGRRIAGRRLSRRTGQAERGRELVRQARCGRVPHFAQGGRRRADKTAGEDRSDAQSRRHG